MILTFFAAHVCVMGIMFRYECKDTDPLYALFPYSKQLISECAFVHYKLEHLQRTLLVLDVGLLMTLIWKDLWWIAVVALVLEGIDYLDYRFRYNEDYFVMHIHFSIGTWVVDRTKGFDFNTIKMIVYALMTAPKIFIYGSNKPTA